MKRKLFTICVIALVFAACHKEQPDTRSNGTREETSQVVESSAKEASKRDWKYCEVLIDGRKVGSGETCALEGDKCGRKPYCYLKNGLPSGSSPSSLEPNEDDVVYEDMTYKEFVKLWNTEEGREELMKKGFYEKTY